MDAWILSSGEEIVSGRLTDTNAGFIARALRAEGIPVRRITAVGDDLARLAALIGEARASARVVVMTGGLGPTRDDLAREALSAALGRPLVENSAALALIEAFYAGMGRRMPESVRREALLPEGTEPLRNACGTAPGICLTGADGILAVLPGVPREMEVMLAAEVLPRLRSLAGPRPVLRGGTLRVAGFTESRVGEILSDLMVRGRNPEIGVTVRGGLVAIRIEAGAASESAALEVVARDAAIVRERFGDAIYGEEDGTLEGTVAALLERVSLTLAVAESVTGGQIADRLIRVPGVSGVFLLGVVAYADRAKMDLLGVPEALLAAHGAVSDETAMAMAEGVRRAGGARIGISTTGIAGPSGGSERKPVGTVHIGIATEQERSARKFVFPGDREMVRERATTAALDLLRLVLVRHGGQAAPQGPLLH